jgi:PKD repeat protein
MFHFYSTSDSFDSDGSIVSWDWDFGDTHTESGVSNDPSTDHVYTAGDYDVILTVTDDKGAIDQESKNISVTGPTTDPAGPHVGDLAGSGQNNGSTWTAVVTITVHDANLPVDQFSVTGSWEDAGTGSGGCETTIGSNGQCTVTLPGIRKRDICRYEPIRGQP